MASAFRQRWTAYGSSEDPLNADRGDAQSASRFHIASDQLFKQVILRVTIRDGAGKTTHQNVNIGLAQFVKSVATVGDVNVGLVTGFRKAFGFLFTYWDYVRYRPFLGFFLQRSESLYDPTTIGQFSNLVGRGIADILARGVSGAIQTHTYEAALLVRKIVHRGPRPDLYCDTGKQQFTLEAKGLSARSVSNQKMNDHKAQASSGPIQVDFAIASIAYNLFTQPSCKYFDPPVRGRGQAEYDSAANLLLAQFKYARLLSVLDAFRRLNDVTIADHAVERFELERFGNVTVSMLVDARIRSFLEATRPLPFRTEQYEEARLFLDSDGVGIELSQNLR